MGTSESISATESSSSRRLFLAFSRLFFALAVVLCVSLSTAQQAADVPQLPETLPDASAFEGKPVAVVRAKIDGAIWTKPPVLLAPKVSAPFALAAARAELARLLAAGGFATGSLEVSSAAGGVEVVYRLVPARLVRRVVFKGNPLADEELRRAAGIAEIRDITEASMQSIADKIRAQLVAHGYPNPQVEVSTIETDQPLVVIVQVTIDAGRADVISERVFSGLPVWDPAAKKAADKYEVAVGARADQEVIEAADRTLANALRASGFPSAAVTHSLAPAKPGELVLTIAVVPGPKVIPSFEGNVAFDRDQLLQILGLEGEADRSPQRLASKIETAYRRRGLYDARVEYEVLGQPTDRERTLRFRIREGDPVLVEKRIYPCLTGALTAARLDEEIDSFLEEDLAHEGFGDANEAGADQTIGGGSGARPHPDLPPTHEIFVAETYDRATEHLRELFRSEGYMFAEIGDAGLLRGACGKKSMPGAKGCKALPPAELDTSKMCLFDPNRLPLSPQPLDKKAACVPDPSRGLECAPTMTVVIPVNPGPRSYLWDVNFDGVKSLSPATLMAKAAGPILRMGEPLSLRDTETARRAIVDYYKDEGYAFATVRVTFEYSTDKSRARLRFLVTEGEQVVIDKIFIEGNRRTLESLIRKRLKIEEGGVYRARLVRDSYDRLAPLGVFQSVNIALVNPSIPAKRKSVVVTVVERDPQHIEMVAGYSTGEGFRYRGEYGYANLFGYAIAFDFRMRISYQPFLGCPEVEATTCSTAFYDPVVVRRWKTETTGLERFPHKISAGLGFPQTPLGSAARLSVDFVNIGDLRRDFVLNRTLVPAVTITYTPWRPLTLVFGGDLEYNHLKAFESRTLNQLVAANPALATQLRIPSGNTGLAATQAAVSFDFRDNRLGATKGWFASLASEIVHSLLPTKDSVTGNEVRNDFLHFDSTVAGYKKLSFLPKQPVLALQLRGGLNLNWLGCWGVFDTSVCDTYPDRLFYIGGVETNRGFFPGQFLPQDSIDQIASDPNAIVNAAPCANDPASPGTSPNVNVGGFAQSNQCQQNLGDLAQRGGNVYINPRAELRVPAFRWGGFVVFVDASNSWRDIRNFQPWRLRYSIGPGVSVETPVGPIALDVGFNLSRYANFGEPVLVFNFSIGRF